MVRLATDEDIRRLLLAYKLKRRGVLSEVIRAGVLKPEQAPWPVWEEERAC